MTNKGCGKKLAKGQWWGFCGETDMGQTEPALCTHCGGNYILKEDLDLYEEKVAAYKKHMEK